MDEKLHKYKTVECNKSSTIELQGWFTLTTIGACMNNYIIDNTTDVMIQPSHLQSIVVSRMHTNQWIVFFVYFFIFYLAQLYVIFCNIERFIIVSVNVSRLAYLDNFIIEEMTYKAHIDCVTRVWNKIP